MSKQTAVEWLEQKFNDPYNNRPFITKEEFEQAKEMEKEQLEDAFVECWKANMPDGFECKLSAKQYYNETYGK
jgi:hypothetical protein